MAKRLPRSPNQDDDSHTTRPEREADELQSSDSNKCIYARAVQSRGAFTRSYGVFTRLSRLHILRGGVPSKDSTCDNYLAFVLNMLPQVIPLSRVHTTSRTWRKSRSQVSMLRGASETSYHSGYSSSPLLHINSLCLSHFFCMFLQFQFLISRLPHQKVPANSSERGFHRR
jgi:hypothetical protein